MTDTKPDTTKPETSLKQPTNDPSVSPGIGGAVSDWNPNHHPLDGSPVLTAVPQRKPAPGQTGAKAKTVAEHNAEVESIADARASGNRAAQW